MGAISIIYLREWSVWEVTLRFHHIPAMDRVFDKHTFILTDIKAVKYMKYRTKFTLFKKKARKSKEEKLFHGDIIIFNVMNFAFQGIWCSVCRRRTFECLCRNKICKLNHGDESMYFFFHLAGTDINCCR